MKEIKQILIATGIQIVAIVLFTIICTAAMGCLTKVFHK